MSTKIAFLGIGNVGAPLAANLARAGHTVTIGARDPGSQSVAEATKREPSLSVLPPLEAVTDADLVFLATPYQANAAALTPVASALAGKILVDCTNPIGAGLTHALESRTSGAEEVQKLAPGARVVKAFSIYGYENFIDSSYPAYDVKPTMLIAGDDADAKTVVTTLCSDLGWDAEDAGPIANSLHLEHVALLWIKMARFGGRGPHFVYAMLKR